MNSHLLLPNQQTIDRQHARYKIVEQMIKTCFNVALEQPMHNNPAPNPVSMDRLDLKPMQQELNHWRITEKSDGIRYLLILAEDQNSKEFACMVNRKLDMFEINVLAPKDYFARGVIADGEMVWETLKQPEVQHQEFFVFDIYWFCGVSLYQDLFEKRYEVYQHIFALENSILLLQEPFKYEEAISQQIRDQGKIASLGNAYGLTFRPKSFLPLSEIATCWRVMKQLQHETDGFILMKNTNVSHAHIIKWKQTHTVDLLCQGKYEQGRWNYFFFYQQDRSSEFLPFDLNLFRLRLNVENIKLKKTELYFGQQNVNKFLLIGEFALLAESSEQQPQRHFIMDFYRWREDKQHANVIDTIKKTIQNVRQNITLEELQGWFGSSNNYAF